MSNMRWIGMALAVLSWTFVYSAPITTVAGKGLGNGELALQARLEDPTAVVLDAQGNLYIADTKNFLIRRVDAQTGMISIYAGVENATGSNADGIPALQAQIGYVHNLAIDGAGNLYLSMYYGCTVRKIDAVSGLISTVAGSVFSCGYAGDGGVATAAQLKKPGEIAVDAAGNLYIADTENHRIRRVDALTKIITTVAGTGVAGFAGDGGQAISAQLNSPMGIGLAGNGAFYIADWANNRVRYVDAGGGVSTVAGSGQELNDGDGPDALQKSLYRPVSVRVHSGELYIADGYNRRIRKVVAGAIATVAGIGWPSTETYAADGSLATASFIAVPQSIDFGPDGLLYFTDMYFHRVRKIDAQGLLQTVAGAEWSLGEGGAATAAYLVKPGAVVVATDQSLIIADTENGRIRKVDVQGNISTLAGSQVELNKFKGENSPAIEATLSYVYALALDAQDNIYFADMYFDRIRKITVATGMISTVVNAFRPTGVVLDAQSNVYYTESDRHRVIRWNAASGSRDTIAGTGVAGFSGDGGPARDAKINGPQGLALDLQGNLYITDQSNHCIRKVDAQGVISTVAGVGGNWGYDGDNLVATVSRLKYPHAVVVDAQGNLYISDRNSTRIRTVNAISGIMSTVAGTGDIGFSGDGAAATQATLNFPQGLALDGAGSLFVADSRNHRIRKIGPMAQTLAFTLPATVTYGDVALALAASASSGETVTLRSLTPAVCAVHGDQLSWLTAGLCSIEAAQSGNADYMPVTVVRTLEIQKKELQLQVATLLVQPKIYDGSTTAEVRGALDASRVVGSDGVILDACVADFADAKVGDSKTVAVGACTLSGAQSGNYVVSSVGTSLLGGIARRSLAVLGVVAQSKDYDGNTSAVLTAGHLDVAVLVAGDGVGLVQGSGEFADAHVGVDKVVLTSGFALQGADAANYELGAQPVLNATIRPRVLEVVAADAQITLGASLPSFSAEVSGFLVGEKLDVLTAPVQFRCVVGTGAGDYAIESFGALAQDYSFRYTAGTLRVVAPESLRLPTGAAQTADWMPGVTTFDLLGRVRP